MSNSGADILTSQVGASGWFVRLNLFAMSQNRWIGHDRVSRKYSLMNGGDLSLGYFKVF